MCMCMCMYVCCQIELHFKARAAGLPDSVSLTGNSRRGTVVLKKYKHLFVCVSINNNKSAVQSNNAKDSVRFWNLLYYFLLCFFVRFILTLHNLFRFLALSATHTHTLNTHAASVRVGERYNLKPLTLSCLCSQRCRYLCRCRRRRRRCCRIWTLPF